MQSTIFKSCLSHQQELFICAIRAHTHTLAYVFEVNALLTINGIREPCKVALNLIGSSQFVRSGQSCFHDDDKILMKNIL